MTRGSDWPNVPGEHDARDLDPLEELEELGDDAIIAQQTAAHAPQPRANVVNEARSVVISDRPAPGPEGTTHRRRARTEKTVIIRDRRKLDEMRQKLADRQARKKQERTRLLYFWSAIGVAAFVLGGIVALFATDQEAAPRSGAPAPAPPPAPLLEARSEPAKQPPAQPAASAESADDAAPSVDLEELPVEKRKPGRR